MSEKKHLKRGRKNNYEEKVKPFLIDIRGWSLQGYKEEQIYKILGVGKNAFYKYKKEHKELRDVLKNGREHLIAIATDTLRYKIIEDKDLTASMYVLNTYGRTLAYKDSQSLKIKKEELEMKKKEVVKEDKQVIININGEDLKKVEEKDESLL